MAEVSLARSALYVPGDAPDKLTKALDRGADELIVDLEDAVPAAGKDAARQAVRVWLHDLPALDVGVWVRVNAGSAARGRCPCRRRRPGADRHRGRQDRDGVRAGRARRAALVTRLGRARRTAHRERRVRAARLGAGRRAAGAAAPGRRGRPARRPRRHARARRARAAARPLRDRARLGRRRDRAADRAGVDQLPRPRRATARRPRPSPGWASSAAPASTRPRS